MATDLRIDRLRKEFESPGGETVVAVNDVSLDIEKGALVTLLGPSGCGKTTLLRLIAGFEEPTGGDIYFGDRRVNDEAPNVRDSAMVFQSYAIFPHLSVFENVAFGLRLKRGSRHGIRERVGRVLELVGLGALGGRSPSQLSGGQQQRVALARCIVMEPRLLLFDEPLSNLDAKLREQMRLEIRDLQQRLGITSVYVTHDQVEAMSISDVLVVMNGGTVEQIGSPSEVYARPANRFVADFIGKVNFVDAIFTGGAVDVAGARWPLPDAPDVAEGSRVTLVLRPEAILMSTTDGPLRGTVRRTVFLGNHAEYLVEVEGVGELVIDETDPTDRGMRTAGDSVFLSLAADALHVLPAES